MQQQRKGLERNFTAAKGKSQRQKKKNKPPHRFAALHVSPSQQQIIHALADRGPGTAGIRARPPCACFNFLRHHPSAASIAHGLAGRAWGGLDSRYKPRWYMRRPGLTYVLRATSTFCLRDARTPPTGPWRCATPARQMGLEIHKELVPPLTCARSSPASIEQALYYQEHSQATYTCTSKSIIYISSFDPSIHLHGTPPLPPSSTPTTTTSPVSQLRSFTTSQCLPSDLLTFLPARAPLPADLFLLCLNEEPPKIYPLRQTNKNKNNGYTFFFLG